MNLASIIESHPDEAVALISRGRTTTYGELRRQVASLRGGLVRAGLEPGDRIGVACGNNWYFAVAYLAGLGAGLAVAPINPQAPAPELHRQLSSIEARALIVGPTARSRVAALDRSALPALDVVIEPNHGDEVEGVEGSLSLDDLVEGDPAPMVERSDDDLAVLVFTSGTAGAPRAAMLTHGNLHSNVEQVQAMTGRAQGTDDVSLGVLPLFHIFGLNVVLNLTLSSGGSVLLVERFDPSSAAEAVAKHGVSVIAGAPTMWAAWASLPDLGPATFSSVRIATSGAARLPVEVAQMMEDRFDVEVREGYGLTEAGPVVTVSTGTDAPRGSIGMPLPDQQVRLVDLAGHDVLVGDPGEVLVRGPNVFVGYLGDEEATSLALGGDGWLRTGDVAVVDDDGHLFLVDRKKDLIIVSGFNVYPAEVEEVLLEHPSIERCAVVGVPHPHTGEAVKAYVVLEAGRSAEEDDVVAWCSERLARYKCPAKVMFVDELPVGAGGKVLRRALR